MKKRGARPNNHTYTHLLGGIARNSKKLPDAANRAEAIYMSISEKGKIRPDIIHANAALQACKEAGDLEAMFRIASTLPSRGPGAPDATTYTVMLRGLELQGVRRARSLDRVDVELLASIWNPLISSGRKLWGDVIDWWKDGDLVLDARLVQTMATLLSRGSDKDVDDIMSLIEQTTGLKRQFPAVGNPERKTHLKLTDPYQFDVDFNQRTLKKETQHRTTPLRDQAPHAEDEIAATPTPTDPDDPNSFVCEPLSTQQSVQSVELSNALLSLVLSACVRLNALSEAQMYWGLFTEKIKPDAQNYQHYLRCLSKRHASTLAVELVESMLLPADRGGLDIPVSHDTLLMGMKACLRDNLNASSIRNALSIMSMAKRKYHHADYETVRAFAKLLNRRTPQPNEIDLVFKALYDAFVGVKSRIAYGHAGRATGTRLQYQHGKVMPSEEVDTLNESEQQSQLQEAIEVVRMTMEAMEKLYQKCKRDLDPGRPRQIKDLIYEQRGWLLREKNRDGLTRGAARKVVNTPLD